MPLKAIIIACIVNILNEKALWTGLWMGWSTLSSLFTTSWTQNETHRLAPQSVRVDKQ